MTAARRACSSPARAFRCDWPMPPVPMTATESASGTGFPFRLSAHVRAFQSEVEIEEGPGSPYYQQSEKRPEEAPEAEEQVPDLHGATLNPAERHQVHAAGHGARQDSAANGGEQATQECCKRERAEIGLDD